MAGSLTRSLTRSAQRPALEAVPGIVTHPGSEFRAGVTTSRNDVRYIVTEYGVAEMFGRTVADRVHQLVKIAHPNFREELLAFAREHYHVGRVYSLNPN